MYPGFEDLEEPENYGELEENLEQSVSSEPDQESLADYFELTVHEGDYSFEDALYVIGSSGIFDYDPDKHGKTVSEQSEYPSIEDFSEEEWTDLAERLPDHLVVEETSMGLGPVDVVNAVEITDEEKEMRRTVSRGMYEMIKRASESYSPMLDETTDIEGSEDFAEAAWQEFQERYPEADMFLLEQAIDDWTEYTGTDRLKQQMEDPESELSKYREFSQEVLRDTFGQDFQMPVMRGHGMSYFAEHDPRIEQREDDIFPDFRTREENIIDQEGVEIERNGIDAWKPREVTFYAASPDRQYEKGVILRQLADPGDMVLVSHVDGDIRDNARRRQEQLQSRQLQEDERTGEKDV